MNSKEQFYGLINRDENYFFALVPPASTTKKVCAAGNMNVEYVVTMSVDVFAIKADQNRAGPFALPEIVQENLEQQI